MSRLVVFNQMSLDGFIADRNGDMGWAHKDPRDAEWNKFVAGNARGGGVLLFGRVTYEMMASFWPTPMAASTAPAVAERMNNLAKVVFSKTLEKAEWKNTRLVKGSPTAEVRRLKKEGREDMAILGSASIVGQLAQEGLVDEFQVVIVPIVLGAGKSMFAGVRGNRALKLTSSRTFGNGSVLLCYEPLG